MGKYAFGYDAATSVARASVEAAKACHIQAVAEEARLRTPLPEPKKVNILGEQQRKVFAEISHLLLATLGARA